MRLVPGQLSVRDLKDLPRPQYWDALRSTALRLSESLAIESTRDGQGFLRRARGAAQCPLRSRSVGASGSLARTPSPRPFPGGGEGSRRASEFQEITQAFTVLPTRSGGGEARAVELVRPSEGAVSGPAPALPGLPATARRQGLQGEALSGGGATSTWRRRPIPRAARRGTPPGPGDAASSSWLPGPWTPSTAPASSSADTRGYLKQAGRILALTGQTEKAPGYYRKALQWGRRRRRAPGAGGAEPAPRCAAPGPVRGRSS